ncbi:MAG TPA: hypothetical protein VIK34_04640, partial [Clostridiaceae bacterium]
MEKYIKKFIQKLNELFGYRITELEVKAGLASNWCCIKAAGGQVQVIVFAELCKEQPVHVDTGLIRESVMRQTGAFGCEVVVIYLEDQNCQGKLEEFMGKSNQGIVL